MQAFVQSPIAGGGHTEQAVRVTIEVLGTGLHGQIHTVVQRIEQQGRGPRVVDRRKQSALAGHGHDCRHVLHLKGARPRRLHEDQAGVVAHKLIDGLPHQRIVERGADTALCQRALAVIACGSIHAVGHEQMIAGRQKGAEYAGDRCHPLTAPGPRRHCRPAPSGRLRERGSSAVPYARNTNDRDQEGPLCVPRTPRNRETARWTRDTRGWRPHADRCGHCGAAALRGLWHCYDQAVRPRGTPEPENAVQASISPAALPVPANADHVRESGVDDPTALCESACTDAVAKQTPTRNSTFATFGPGDRP